MAYVARSLRIILVLRTDMYYTLRYFGLFAGLLTSRS